MSTMPTWSAAIEGAPAGKADYPIEIATLVANLKNAAPSYHAASAPFSVALLEAVEDRPGGRIFLYRAGSLWSFFNLAGVTYNVGGRSGSMLFRGYRQQTYTGPASLVIAEQSVEADRVLADGTRTITIDPSIEVKPEDQIEYGGQTYRASRVDFYLTPSRGSLSINLAELIP